MGPTGRYTPAKLDYLVGGGGLQMQRVEKLSKGEIEISGLTPLSLSRQITKEKI